MILLYVGQGFPIRPLSLCIEPPRDCRRLDGLSVQAATGAA